MGGFRRAGRLGCNRQTRVRKGRYEGWESLTRSQPGFQGCGPLTDIDGGLQLALQRIKPRVEGINPSVEPPDLSDKLRIQTVEAHDHLPSEALDLVPDAINLFVQALDLPL